jgi:hypothetical protein
MLRLDTLIQRLSETYCNAETGDTDRVQRQRETQKLSLDKIIKRLGLRHDTDTGDYFDTETDSDTILRLAALILYREWKTKY